MTPDFDAFALTELQQRTSVKWRYHPPDVLPMWVAEMDVPLAAPVQAALRAAVEASDTGYTEPTALAPAFAGFARRRWGWTVDVERCWPVADVMVGVAETLRALTRPGDGVVICPPVYSPFFTVPVEHDRVAVQVPLTGENALDLAGIDAALAAGARAVLLCSPHNPLGRVWTAPELDALDQVVRRHDALVVSDEIHAPLTLPGATFTPYLAAGERRAVAVVSASKAFNLAGLKAALLVAGNDEVQARLSAMPVEVRYRVGHFGALAGTAAYDEGDAWLDALLLHLDGNRQLLATLLAEHLPDIGYAPPQASYLAWLDCRTRGDRPAERALERGRVALVEGTDFGAPGAGHARLNLGTTRAILAEGVRRLAAGLGG